MTIYVAPFGALLCAVLLYLVLGLPAVKAELNRGRARPLGKWFDGVAYLYVLLAAAVFVLGIAYGGIG